MSAYLPCGHPVRCGACDNGSQNAILDAEYPPAFKAFINEQYAKPYFNEPHKFTHMRGIDLAWLAWRAARAEALREAVAVANHAANEWSGMECNGGDIDRKHEGDSESAAAIVSQRIAALEDKFKIPPAPTTPAPPEAKDEFYNSGFAAEGDRDGGQRDREACEDASRIGEASGRAEQGGEQARETVPRMGRDRGGRERRTQDDGRRSVGADAPRRSEPDLAKDEERCAEHVPAAGAGAYAICNMPRDHWRHAKIGGHTFVPQEKGNKQRIGAPCAICYRLTPS